MGKNVDNDGIEFVTCIICLNICGANWGTCPSCGELLPEREEDDSRNN